MKQEIVIIHHVETVITISGADENALQFEADQYAQTGIDDLKYFLDDPDAHVEVTNQGILVGDIED